MPSFSQSFQRRRRPSVHPFVRSFDERIVVRVGFDRGEDGGERRRGDGKTEESVSQDERKPPQGEEGGGVRHVECGGERVVVDPAKGGIEEELASPAGRVQVINKGRVDK